jgi:hypothetical protein
VPPEPITIHLAALRPLKRDFLALSDAAIADWLMDHAPGCFVRLLVVDAGRPYVLVPAARWAAVGRDVLGIEKEVAHDLN